jgi:hypothetical protein
MEAASLDGIALDTGADRGPGQARARANDGIDSRALRPLRREQ